MKRFAFPVATLVGGLGSLAATMVHAAPPAALLCGPGKTVDCVQDEIVILDGNGAIVLDQGLPTQEIRPLTFGCEAKMVGDRLEKTCNLNQGFAVDYALRLLKSNGVTGLSWDTVTVFGADMGANGPVFIRTLDTNSVRGIGLPVAAGDDTRPFVGRIEAGSSTEFGVWKIPPEDPPTGLDKWPEPDPAGVDGFAFFYEGCGTTSTCFSGSFNGYQALAAATGRVHGPYVKLANNAPSESSPNADPPVRGKDRPFVVNLGAGAQGASIQAWNSLFDLDGSLLGGNNWRENGDGTIETASPTPFWIATGALQGQRVARFHPIELYLMGLAPGDALTAIPDYSNLKVDPRFNFVGQSFGNAFGLARGARLERTGLVPEKNRLLDPLTEIIAANGPRVPAFENAIHHHRQLWILVTKPNDPEATAEAIRLMQRFRRGWNRYYYMLTSYRGRMVTTFDGKEDDSAYFEFGQPIDDERTFVPEGGLTAIFPEPQDVPGASEVIETFTRVQSTPGAAGRLRFTPHNSQLPLRIKGDLKNPGAFNTLAVRMRIPAGGLGGVAATATLQLDTGVNITLPPSAGGTLIADGRWHTYSVDLNTVAGFGGAEHTGFAFSPASVPASNIDIDFIRFAWVDPEELADKDLDCAYVVKADGFLDTEDNCPDHFNPTQADEDGNGVGDACEDVDQDGIVNSCDNCPLLTNSRQRDRDNDSRGDACDSDPGSGCFLQPESIAGAPPRGGGGWLLLVSVALAGLFVRARRRRTG